MQQLINRMINRYVNEINIITGRLFSALLFVLFVIFGMVVLSGLFLILNKKEILNDLYALFSFELAIIWAAIFLLSTLSALTLIILLRKNYWLNQKRDEERKYELEASERKYKAVIDHSPVAIVQFDQNLIITGHNPELKAIIKTEKENLIGSDLRILFNKDFSDIFQKAINGVEKHFESWYRSSDKAASKFICVNAAPVLGKNDLPESAVAIIQDVTIKKSAETELKKSNRYLSLTSKSNRSLLDSKSDYRLIENICSVLVKDGGYNAASVAFINDINRSEFIRVYSKGNAQIDKLFSDQFNVIKKIQTPFLTSVKMNKPITFYPNELFEERTDEFGNNKTMVFPLDGKGTPFGILVLQVDKSLKIEQEEFDLITEIASDLAFGLSKFEIEDRHSIVKNALFESEEKFRMLINSTDDIVFTLDKNKRLQGLYGSWIKKGGVKPHLFLGKDAVEIMGIEKGKIHFEAAEKTLLGENVTYEFDYTENDRILYFITTLSPIFDEEGKVTEIVGVGKNITELKESSLALQREHTRNKIYLDTTSDGYVLFRPDGDIIEFNKSFMEMTGISKSDKKSYNLKSFIADCENLDCLTNDNSITAGKSVIYETDLIRITDNTIPVEIITNKLNLDNNVVFISSIRDLTKRIESEARLRFLSKAIENSPAGVIITDATGNINYINKRYEEISGYKSDELIGKNPRVLKSGHTPQKVYKDLWETLIAGKEWGGELHNRKKNGETYWVKALISPMIDDKGRTTHFVAIKEDISQKKEMERALIEAKEKAEEMNKLKSNFLANMSHELRTPMIGILGYSELLKSELADNKGLYDLASVINRGGIRLMETLNLILDLSRIESGNLDVNYSVIDIEELIEENILLYDENAKQKNLIIGTEFQAERMKINTDGRMLSLAINNLINNAIKFTQDGSVIIGVKTVIENNQELIEIFVRDTGIGIPKEKHHIIFDEFRQVSEGYSRSFEGTGLGLTLTKKAVEIINGTISVDSQPETGSTFTIKLPAETTLQNYKLTSN